MSLTKVGSRCEQEPSGAIEADCEEARLVLGPREAQEHQAHALEDEPGEQHVHLAHGAQHDAQHRRLHQQPQDAVQLEHQRLRRPRSRRWTEDDAFVNTVNPVTVLHSQ